MVDGIALEIEQSLLDRAVNAAKEMKEANAERLVILEREEKLKAMEMIGGRSEAGQKPVIKEETAQEYARRIMAGKL